MKNKNLTHALDLSRQLLNLHLEADVLNWSTLSMSVFHILASALMRDKTVTMKSLSADCSVASSVLRRLIRDLERQGWVDSEVHMDDFRVRAVKPTPKFEAAVHQYAAACHHCITQNILHFYK